MLEFFNIMIVQATLIIALVISVVAFLSSRLCKKIFLLLLPRKRKLFKVKDLWYTGEFKTHFFIHTYDNEIIRHKSWHLHGSLYVDGMYALPVTRGYTELHHNGNVLKCYNAVSKKAEIHYQPQIRDYITNPEQRLDEHITLDRFK